MINGIMFVTVHVTDQDRALEFYTGALGLEKQIDYSGPDGRFLAVGVPDHPVRIILWPDEKAAGSPDEAGGSAAPGVLVLESGDLREDFEVLRRRGVTFTDPEPVDYPFGVRAEAVDPDGNRISFRQPRTR
ncbi:VOC family protein [Actinomadura fibrosa]|uniref:VOC family protein n=1 Tax=Actinomadura fibrosa TaxID=111802 RepID=A0ABW2XEI8_9ACTN|nr:VOC family protein [Actinomadura fibrosa]